MTVALLVESPPEFLVVPFTDCKARLGIEQTIITPDDMTSYDAYWRLWAEVKTQFRQTRPQDFLEETDFKNPEHYYKYFMLSLGLLDYPMVLIGGDPGKGKSLIRSALTFRSMKHFNKTACMDTPPPNPELYPGRVHNLYDQQYVNLVVGELARLNMLQKNISNCPDKELRIQKRQELQKHIEGMVLYNAVGSYDESHMWGDCSRRFNLTVLISRIAMIRRHLYMGMYFCYINPMRADKLIFDAHTHEIECFKDAFIRELGPGFCSFQITDKRPGGTGTTKWMHLRPEQWKEYWDSENIPSVVNDVEIYLGGKKKSKPTKADWDAITPQLE